MESKQILIVGYYGMKNTGDDAMLYSLVNGIHKFRPEIHIKIAVSGYVTLPEGSLDRVTFVPRSSIAIMREVRNCGAVIWGGGTAIFNYPGKNWKWFKMLARQAILFRMAKMLGKKVFFVGIGLGPFHGSWAKWLAKCAIGAAEHISLRDPEGYALAQSWKLKCHVSEGFDLSTLLFQVSEKNKSQNNNRNKVLGFSLLPYYEMFKKNPSRDDVLRQHFTSTIKVLLNDYSNLNVRLFVFKGRNRDHDVDFIESLYQSLKVNNRVTIIPYNPDPLSRIKEVGCCDFFVGMRLHSSIFAYLHGLPMVILNYHEKCLVFKNQIQLAERAILSLEQMESEVLTRRIKQLISNPEAFRAALPQAALQQKTWNMLEELCRRL